MEQISLMVVEDDQGLNSMICDYLKALDYRVHSALDGTSALDLFRGETPDLLILDWMLPGMDGIDLIRRIRSSSDVPVIMLTARAEEGDKLLGLEIGADDYMTKPFSLKELDARIRVILRRIKRTEEREPQERISQAGLELDRSRMSLKKNGKSLDLTAVQFDILWTLMESPGRVFKRMDLLGAFQEDPWEGYERTIDVHIKNIRKLIEEDPSQPRLIETVWSVGYRFSEAPS